MKKFVLPLLFFCTISYIVYSSEALPISNANPTTTSSTLQQPATNTSNITQLSLQANGKSFIAEIEHNTLTEQFLAKLPRTLKMQQLRDTSVIYGDTPISMPGNLLHGLKKGDLAYCQYGYFIIFTDDQAANHTTGFIKVGRITSANLDELTALAHGAEVRFALAQ